DSTGNGRDSTGNDDDSTGNDRDSTAAEVYTAVNQRADGLKVKSPDKIRANHCLNLKHREK
ncbi:MAG: hypothetical protein WBP45_02970, partial [Daejeonella sp.]